MDWMYMPNEDSPEAEQRRIDAARHYDLPVPYLATWDDIIQAAVTREKSRIFATRFFGLPVTTPWGEIAKAATLKKKHSST